MIGNPSSIEEPSKLGLRNGGKVDSRDSSCSKLRGILCGCLVKEDCRKDEDLLQQSGEEDALFCTLCNAEVQLFIGDINFLFYTCFKLLLMILMLEFSWDINSMLILHDGRRERGGL